MARPLPNDQPLPRLRRKRKVDLPKIIGRFLPGVAEIDGQVERYARQWDESNEQARSAQGPLWIALGDSATQGVGASAWDRSWPHIVLARLREHTGEPWRLINLAMSGGRFLDVAHHQIPVLETRLEAPQLVTCAIGSNDLMWRRGVSGVVRDAKRTISRIPEQAFVSRLNGPGPRPKLLNEAFERGATDRGHQLFNIWNWPSGRGALAADRVHPSDIGYGYMAELAWEAIEADLDR